VTGLRQFEVVDEVVGGGEAGEAERREPGDDGLGRCRSVGDMDGRIDRVIGGDSPLLDWLSLILSDGNAGDADAPAP
jgi:hypothetical protein